MAAPVRWFLAFCLALTLQAGVITATPAVPLPGQPVTFTLLANPDPFGEVRWSFGDGGAAAGTQVAFTTYRASGSYTVQAVYRTLANGKLGPAQAAQTQIRVADAPGGAFGLAQVRLRWEDGGMDAAVPKGFAPLVAYLDLKATGTGILVAQWLVDGVPVATLARPLAFGAVTTLDTRDLPALPTTEPGPHLVTLRILAPAVTFTVPSIRYFVQLDPGAPPQVETVTPASANPGEEVDLILTGRGLTADTRLSFGKDIVLVAPLRLLGPGRAAARIYLAPGARPGLRPALAANGLGEGRGPGGLRVTPARP